MLPVYRMRRATAPKALKSLYLAARLPTPGDNRMQQPSWERIQEIYHSALALPRSDRDAFVAEACAGDSGLEREVKSLLKAHDLSGFLDSPVCRVGSEPDDVIGTTINDRYLVEKKLKRGGMGQVYYA